MLVASGCGPSDTPAKQAERAEANSRNALVKIDEASGRADDLEAENEELKATVEQLDSRVEDIEAKLD